MHCDCEHSELCRALRRCLSPHEARIWRGEHLDASAAMQYRQKWAAEADRSLPELQQLAPFDARGIPLPSTPANGQVQDSAPREVATIREPWQLPCLYRGQTIGTSECRPCQNEGINAIPVYECEINLKCVLRGVPTDRRIATCLTCTARRAPEEQLHPYPIEIKRWAVGITTAPRPVPTVASCIVSTLQAGWERAELRVFVDNRGDTTGIPPEIDCIHRPRTIAPPLYDLSGPKFGAWANFVQSVADLLCEFPDAQALLMIQDDVQFCKGLKAFLSRDLWPSHATGLVSPYCPNSTSNRERGVYIDDHTIGCRRVRRSYLIAGQTFIFPREVAEQLVTHPLSQTWRGRVGGNPEPEIPKRKALDAYVGHVMKSLGLRSYFYNPSLAQHEEPIRGQDNSALSHGQHQGFRRAGRFVGHDTDATSVFRQHVSPLRYRLPSGDQKFRDPKPTAAQLAAAPVGVVIPAYESLDLTLRCLTHLARSQGPLDLKVCLVDNGSSPETVREVRRAMKRKHFATVTVRNEMNLGFTRAINQGLEQLTGRHVLLLNNDCFLGRQTLLRMLTHLLWHPRTAAVGPLTSDDGNNSLKNRIRRQQAQVGLKRIARRWEDLDHLEAICQRPYIVAEKVLPFFCTLLHRDALEQIGHLDESFESGLAADDDWCIRASKAGYQNLITCDAFALHLHRSTFRRNDIDRNRLLRQAHRQLKEKHAR